MYKYGFELEGFCYNSSTQALKLPPVGYPTDGFPGIVELRSVGGNYLIDSFLQVLKAYMELDKQETIVSFANHEAYFSASQLAQIRKGGMYIKEPVDVQNIYNKPPRDSKGKTLASFQINISNELRAARDVEKFHIPASYGMLDIPRIVRNLDKAFLEDIARAKRQPGMYAIKDGYRLEYRSLPNFSFSFSRNLKFLNKIREAVEG